MSHTLLLVSIGPVQQFIGQARRMRDLWFGSHLLSEMSRAAARALVAPDCDWKLIFPALDPEDPELRPCAGTTRPETRKPPLGIANKVVAIRENADDTMVSEAAQAARRAAIAVWEGFADSAVARAGQRLLAVDLAEHEHPKAVVESFLEVVVGWSTYAAEGDFESARLEAEQAVAARKALRDFRQWAVPAVGSQSTSADPQRMLQDLRQWQDAPYRKSSLDGQRESILADREPRRERPKDLAHRLRLSPREHLDGIGLVKRAAGEPKQFVPVARVAVEPWLKAVDEAAKQYRPLYDRLIALEAECAKQDVPCCQRGVTRWLQGAFLYDGEIFFEGQWPALTKELDLHDFFEPYVRPFFRKPLSIPEPHPYVACLSADGDRMGAALATLGTASLQSRLSRALADFSRGVRDIVEDHSGLHIYAGGDDVLAILPVIHAVPCAEALRAAFVEAVHPLFADEIVEPDAPPPTLSVGIGIAHFLTPLGQLLDLARDAEKHAKQGDKLPERQRNALAVKVDKRSGATIAWRGQWQPDRTPGGRLACLIGYLRNGLMPAKLPYELGKVLKDLDDMEHVNDRSAGKAWRLEILRILARKRPDATNRKLTAEDIGLELPLPEDARVGNLREALRDWVQAAMVAHALADAEDNVNRVKVRGIALEKQHED